MKEVGVDPKIKIVLLGMALGLALSVTILGLWVFFVFGIQK